MDVNSMIADDGAPRTPPRSGAGALNQIRHDFWTTKAEKMSKVLTAICLQIERSSAQHFLNN
jgi:hypothetical protein